MEAVVGCNYLYRRGGTYWFRRRVPDDVQAAIGTPQWRESLRTKDFETAKRAVRRKGVETDGLISTARARLAGKASPPLDPAQAYALAESWLSEVLDSEQDTRIAGGAAGHASTEAWLLEYAADYRRDLALMSLPAAGYAVEKALADAVLWYPENDPSRRLLGIEMLKARVRLIDMLERRLEGEVVDVAAPTLAALTTPPTSGITVGKLIAAFNAERVARHGEESTSRKYSHIFSALEEVLGTDKPVRSVTRADIREVRSLLQRVPKFATRRYPGLTLTEAADKADEDDGERIAPTTVNTYLQNLAAVFNWAVSEDYIDRSPAQGMKLSADARVQRRGFTPEELDTLFKATAPMATGEHPWRFWIPALALYSGARANELAGLRKADLVVVDGIQCMRFSKFDEKGQLIEGRKLKTQASERTVPIHRVVLDAGLMSYVATIPKETDRLFPSLRPAAHGSFSHNLSRWFSKFRHDLGLSDPATVFHSFRHGFLDAARDAAIPEELAHALGGWTTGGVATRPASCPRPARSTDPRPEPGCRDHRRAPPRPAGPVRDPAMPDAARSSHPPAMQCSSPLSRNSPPRQA
ncbi:DUF6538 domain-containing protein [Brevundimonas bullata]|uniref:DUF6538 domain-containing protein n=1 Tax=Brevundimonas bullata TaxID=13160 RepID=UPI002FDA66B0